MPLVHDPKHILRYKVRSYCMEPYLLDEDELIINTQTQQFQPGDILAFFSQNQDDVRAHRLVGSDPEADCFLFRSDRNIQELESIPRTSVLGKVEYILRQDRLLAASPSGFQRSYVLHIKPRLRRMTEMAARWLEPFAAFCQKQPWYRPMASPWIHWKTVYRDLGNRQECFAAMINGRFAGHVLFEVRKDHKPILWISDLRVRIRFRGVGIAGSLLEQCEHLAKKKGLKELWLLVQKGNVRGKALYQKLGFSKARDDEKEAWMPDAGPESDLERKILS